MRYKLLTLAVALPALIVIFSCLPISSSSAQERTPALAIDCDEANLNATCDTDPKKWFADSKKFNDLPVQYHANVDVETPPYQLRPDQRPQQNGAEIDDILVLLRTLTNGYKP
jgi:hypothetical protein